MTIIVLQGKAGIGKTTVITKLYHKLCALYLRKAYFSENQVGDFTAIFEIDEHIVGITSIGDSAKDLEHPFEMFEKNQCEVCVACSRKKNDAGVSKKFIEDKAKDLKARVVSITKAYTENWGAKYNAGMETDKINDIQADILLQEISENLK